MSEQREKLQLYMGGSLIGIITPTHGDFPWHYGTFEAAQDFLSVAELFETELRL